MTREPRRGPERPLPDPADGLAGLVAWCACLGAVSAEALANRTGTSLASARARLRSAVGDELLERWRPLRDRPSLYTATRLGIRATGMDGADAGRVSAAGAVHALACASAAVRLESIYADHAVIGLPELRRRERLVGETLASAWMHDREDGSPLRHRPDLVLWPSGPEPPIAVEIELTVKAPRRLAEICAAWARSPAVGGVIYIAPQGVRAPLRRAAERARAGARLLILDFDAVVGDTGGGPPVDPDGGAAYGAQRGITTTERSTDVVLQHQPRRPSRAAYP